MTKKHERALIALFEKWSGEKCIQLCALPLSGSYRVYYRLFGETKIAIGAYNSDKKENIAFITFTTHFQSKGLPVPEILAENETEDIYLLQDLGDITLFSFLTEVRKDGSFPPDLVELYKKVIKKLPEFQICGSEGLDYSVCYPRDSFDRQSMMWDLNYFKYYFLKLAKIPFEEQALEEDFNVFCEYLLKSGREYFLYRDFQSRNIMIYQNEPYFIDYQGGRKGSLHYDLASLLFDAKADIPNELRREFLLYYIKNLKKYIEVKDRVFIEYFYANVLIRILQAMGAYGFRGFYEKKEHFLKSIPYALDNLDWLLNNIQFPVKLPTLLGVLKKMVESTELKKFGEKKTAYKLSVSINSFSYKKGIPQDASGNGGGFVFDCRALHNPGRYDEYKLLTGKDQKVRNFLESEEDAKWFLEQAAAMVNRSIEVYTKRKFSHLMINFGCTGGQHRSVYCAEKLAEMLSSNQLLNVKVTHIEQGAI